MATGLFYDKIFLEHNTGSAHPENAQRLKAIRHKLEKEEIWHKIYRPVTFRCDNEFLENIHTRRHVHRIMAAVKNAPAYLDPDTVVCEKSFDAALTAVSAAVEATDQIMAGELRNAFCAVRPPGHHAEKDRAMGFCLFNNVALAAWNLIAKHHLQRVLIIDWDVHHGNGTQQAFYEDNHVYFVSLHQMPLYPGTGKADEIGEGAGKGFTRNIPFAPFSDPEAYMAAFREVTTSVMKEFEPQFVLISAGFDAHRDDPMAQLNLDIQHFADMTTHVLHLAAEICHGRVMSILEGGYNLQALAESVCAHIQILMNFSYDQVRSHTMAK